MWRRRRPRRFHAVRKLKAETLFYTGTHGQHDRRGELRFGCRLQIAFEESMAIRRNRDYPDRYFAASATQLFRGHLYLPLTVDPVDLSFVQRPPMILSPNKHPQMSIRGKKSLACHHCPVCSIVTINDREI